MSSKEFLKLMISAEVLSTKTVLIVGSFALLIYTGQILAILTKTWQMRHDALQIRPTKLLEVTERPAAMYKAYLKRFAKNYGNEEAVKRFCIFKESLKEIAYLNRESGARHGLTKFSDVSEHEMFTETHRLQTCETTERNCSVDDVEDSFIYDLCTNLHDDKDIPKSFDWRHSGVVGPVMDQKQCNGCWAFGIAGIMESMAAIRNYEKGVRRSVQELIDCVDYSNGCNGGNVVSALKWLCQNQWGVVTEDKYPLRLINGNCTPTQSSPIRRVKQYCQLCGINEDDILRYVYFHGPVIAVVNARPWINYIDGIIQRACIREKTTKFYVHVVQIVGYDLTADIPHYIIRNSWGEDFGEGGYVKLAIGSNVCGVAEQITFFDVYENM